ncbi:hypothetical protein Btru_044031 [Bulinus truncatus]|nr:hypothetical protein Btru_044031 [Bulinus truncatus]
MILKTNWAKVSTRESTGYYYQFHMGDCLGISQISPAIKRLYSQSSIDASVAAFSSNTKQNMDTPASPEAKNNLDKTPRLLKELSSLRRGQSQRLYREHKNVVDSVKEIEEEIHLLFIVHCLHLMIERRERVTGQKLYIECQNLWQTFSKDVQELLYRRFPESEIRLSSETSGGAANAGESLPSSSMAATSQSGGLRSASFETSAPVTLPAAPTSPRGFGDVVVGGATAAAEQSQASNNVATSASSAYALDVTDNVNFSRRHGTLSWEESPKLGSGKSSETAPLPLPLLLGAEGVTAQDEVRPPTTTGTTEEDDDVNMGDERPPQRSQQQPDPRHVKECLWAVQYENKILENYKMCTMCKKNPRDITFLPCGHFITCRECAGPVYTCTLCQRAILATIDTYLS